MVIHQYAEIFVSADGQTFTFVGKGENFERLLDQTGLLNYHLHQFRHDSLKFL